MSVIPYPTLRLKLIMPQAFRLQLHDQNKLEMRFLPALPGFNATQAANKVSGPGDGVSTDNAIARWDGTNGRVIQNSLNIIDDLGNTSIAGSFSVTGPSKLAGYVADTTINYFVPTNGGSAILANDAWYVVLTPAATIATYTLTLPALPNDGQIINIKSARTITSFDLNANSGQTIDNDAGLFPVGLPAGGTITATYRTSTSSWSVAVPGSATVVDGDKGDITVAGGVWTIDNDVVTYAKMQNISTNGRVLGRKTAGAGDPEELTGADLKTFIGSGDLTKLDDTNVTMTMTGTPTGALFNSVSLQLGWTGLLGPTRGGTGLGTYVLGDVLYSSAANTLARLAGNITTGKQYLSQTGTGSISAAPAWAGIAGADISGAALTKVDDTNVTLALGGTPATALLRAASITAGWAGTLSVARGGIGVGTLSGFAFGNGTSPFTGLTDTQATARLDLFTNLLKGVVPGSGGGTVNFLRADGSWALPPGSGSGTGLIVLTADTTYYVDVTLGSDVTGDGTIGLPWQTLQHALFWVQQHVNVGSPYSLTIKLADGTYSEGPFLYAPVFVGTLSALSLGAVFILGNDLDPSAVVIDTAGGFFYSTARLLMQYVTFESTTVQAEGGQAALFIGNCRTTGAAPMGFAQFWANNGALVELKDIEVDGTADAFMYADINSTINYKQGALTLTSDPLWPAGCFNLKRFSNGQFNPDGGVTGTSSGVKINLVEHARLNIISPAVLADVPGASIGTYDPDCEVSVDGTVVLGGDGMKVLTANTTYYVDITLGSDVTGDGSVGNPWQHLHYAIRWVEQHINVGGAPFTLAIQLADGTYGPDPDFLFGGFAPGIMVPAFMGVSAGGNAGPIIQGNASDPSAVTIDTGGGVFYVAGSILAPYLTFQNTAIQVVGGTAQFFGGPLRLGDTPFGGAFPHISAYSGAIVQVTDVEIIGVASSYLYAEDNATIHHDHDYLTLTVDPLWPDGTFFLRKFSNGYMNTDGASNITGTSSGPKYKLTEFCRLTFLSITEAQIPGSSPGTMDGFDCKVLAQVGLSDGVQIDPTPAEETALLVPFIGDSGSGGVKGLVPAPGAGDAARFLKGDGTWSTSTGGTGTPGGSTTQIQYNNAGAFGGMSNFTHSSGNPNVSLSGSYLYNGTDMAFAIDPGGGQPLDYFLAGSGNHSVTGHTNIGIGPNAFAVLSSGQRNIAIGLRAQWQQTNGSQNVIIGNDATILGAGGNNNVAIGQEALASGGGDSFSVAIGSYALTAAAGGGFNFGLGYASLTNVTTGALNVGVGYFTGGGITTGSGNVVIGSSVGGLTSNLTNNIIFATGSGAIRARYNDATSAYDGWEFFGTQGVKASNFDVPAGGTYKYDGADLAFAVPISTAPTNYFLGSSGNRTVTGAANFGEGPGCLVSLTSGQRNLAMGNLSLNACTTGSFNCAMGINALLALTTGSNNMAVGTGALQGITTGTDNVAIGVNACPGAASDSFNTAVGRFALGAMGGTDGNTAVGYAAGADITTGARNTIVGYNTGRGITNGNFNTIIGPSISGLASNLSYQIIIARGDGTIEAQYDGNLGSSGGWKLSGDWGVQVNGTSFLLRSSVTLPAGGTGNAPTLTAGPVNGNPTKWIPIDDNGTTRYIPAW